MEPFKDVVVVISTIVGIIATVAPLVARFVDKKKKAAKKKKRRPAPEQATPKVEDEPEVPIVVDVQKVEQAKSLVKWPAVAVIVMGFLGLAINLMMAGATFVDQFVVQLGDARLFPTEGRAVFGIISYFCLAASAIVGILAGFSMMNLKNYWMSVLGSLGVMPGGILCCFLGIPAGIWAMTVLLQSEVKSSFS